jgi:hypothetical protein
MTAKDPNADRFVMPAADVAMPPPAPALLARIRRHPNGDLQVPGRDGPVRWAEGTAPHARYTKALEEAGITPPAIRPPVVGNGRPA